MFTPENLDRCSQLIDPGFVAQGADALRRRQRQLSQLLSSRQLPYSGWDDVAIEMVLRDLSAMDSNQFFGAVGAGEREGRVYSGIVRRRHFGFAHGVGRSGDVQATQPKAAGSSIVVRLTNLLVPAALRDAGLVEVRHAVVLPMATGMSLALALLTLRSRRPTARYVIWSRIDQKSCFKSILTAGFEPRVVQLVRVGDALVTDVPGVEAAIEEVGAEDVACVLTTTSCFAPRAPDDVEGVARACKRLRVPHVINNAYGLGCALIGRAVSRAQRVGRVDYIVQSTDKNFMVPVGGCIVAGAEEDVAALAQTYAGRASASPVLDLFITLLSMGREGWAEILATRRSLAAVLRSGLSEVGAPHGFRVLDVPGNTISFALGFQGEGWPAGETPDLTRLGSMLFTRGVSGARVCTGVAPKRIGPTTFQGWGTHENEVRIPYITLACANGLQEADVPVLLERFGKTLTDWRKDANKRRKRAAKAGEVNAREAKAGETETGETEAGETEAGETEAVEIKPGEAEAAGATGAEAEEGEEDARVEPDAMNHVEDAGLEPRPGA